MQNSLVARKEGDFYSEFVSYSRNENIRGIELPRKLEKKRGTFIQNSSPKKKGEGGVSYTIKSRIIPVNRSDL